MAKKSARHNARRERYIAHTPPKPVARLRRKPELIHTGPALNPAQLRALHAITNEQI